MRVLVAGASGAIGRYLVPQLRDANHEVIGITRTPGSLAKYVGVREIVADVLDRDALFSALSGVKADAVIHQLTALQKAPATFRDMRMTNRLRAEGTSSLIAAARKIGAKKLVAASFFGGYGLVDLGGETVDELAPFGEPDGRSDAVLKALLSLEQQVHAFGGVTLRYGLFYDSTTTSAGPVSRTWNGVLPMLHVEDAAHAAVLALAKGKPGEAYNIADSSPMSYRSREFARAAAAGLRPPAQYSDSVLRLVAPFGSLMLTRQSIRMSSAKAETELGWTAQYPSLADGLTRVSTAEAVARKPLVIPLAITPVIPIAEPEAVTPVIPIAQPEAITPVIPIAELEAVTPVPEPVAELEAVTPVPEPVEGPTEEPDRESPVDESHDPEPANPEPEETDETQDTPSDPFADIDAAIARIGHRNKG
jgi:nucleoside-diphosphate-sugar epimerase